MENNSKFVIAPEHVQQMIGDLLLENRALLTVITNILRPLYIAEMNISEAEFYEKLYEDFDTEKAELIAKYYSKYGK